MNVIKFSRAKTLAQALNGDANTVYFTTDSHNIVMGGEMYGDTRKLLDATLTVTKSNDTYTATTTGLDKVYESGQYYCTGTTSQVPFELTVITTVNIVKQEIHFVEGVSDLNPATDYIIRSGEIRSNGVATWGAWTVKKDDHGTYWSDEN